MKPIPLGLCLLLPGALAIGAARLQGGMAPPQPGTPLTIMVPPDSLPQKGALTITGEAVPPLDGGQQVSVKVFFPDGTSQTVRVAPTKDGNFRFNYPVLEQLGRYRVVIFDYNLQNNIECSFNVLGPVETEAQILSRMRALHQHSEAVVASVARHVHARRPGPSREEAARRLELAKQKLAELKTRLDSGKAALDGLVALHRYPDLSGFVVQAETELAEWSRDAAETDRRLAEYENKTRNMPTMCDSLDTAAEGLAFVASATTIITEPLSLLKSFAVGKLQQAIDSPQLQRAAEARAQALQVRSNIQSVAEGVPDLRQRVTGAAQDASTYIVRNLFDDYCQVIEGTVESDFSVDAKQGADSYWKYRVVLKANMKLWAEKTQQATPQGVPFTGRIEGNTSRLEFFEDIFKVEPVKNGTVFLRKKIMPRVVGNVANEGMGLGQVVHMASPGHFNVRYLGWLKEDELVLKQDAVLNDFSSAYQNMLAVGISPQGGLVPIFRMFKFPIQKAAWMIDRTTKGEPVAIPVTRNGNDQSMEKTFTRNEKVSQGQTAVSFKVDYKLAQKPRAAR